MDLKQLELVLDLAKKYGVASMKMDDKCVYEIHMQMAPQVLTMPAMDERGLAEALKSPLDHPATEDEVLLWSAGGAEQQRTDGTDFIPPLVGEDDGGKS